MSRVSQTGPTSKPFPEHIHPFSQSDAAILSACTEFPTFSAAFAKVAQVALPTLEREVWHAYVLDTLSNTEVLHETQYYCHNTFGKHTENKGFVCVECDDATVDVSVSLPTFAWDIERCVALPVDGDVFLRCWRHRVNHLTHELLLQKREAPITEKTKGPVTGSLDSLFAVFHRLATICTDVNVSVWIAVPHARDNRSHDAAKIRTFNRAKNVDDDLLPFCFEKCWHCGLEVVTAAGGQTGQGHTLLLSSNFQRWTSAGTANGAYLVTRCSARGLFDNLPLRQAAFKVASANAQSNLRSGLLDLSSWAATSASAQRTRREEQNHILAVLFQTAACTALAPLYLHPNSSLGDTAGNVAVSSSVFTARLFPGQLQELRTLGGTASGNVYSKETRFQLPANNPVGRRDNFPRAKPSAQTDDDVAAHSHQRGTLAGLSCDRFGIRRGCLTVWRARQTVRKTPVNAAPQALSPAEVAVRDETRGEATATRLCDVFSVQFPPFQTGSQQTRAHRKWCTSTRTSHVHAAKLFNSYNDSFRFTEVVVQAGSFAVLFHTTLKFFPQPHPSAIPVLSAPPSGSAIRLSPHFAPSFHTSADTPVHNHQGTTNCLIIVGEQQRLHPKTAKMETLPCPSLPRYRVLESDHWAYDVVVTQTRSPNGPSIFFDAATPVFIFVDAALVPTHLGENRQRQRPAEPWKGKVASTFAQLFTEAVTRLRSGPPAAAPKETLETSSTVDTTLQQPSPDPLYSEEFGADLPNREATDNPTDRSEDNAIVELGTHVSPPISASNSASSSGADSGEIALRMEYVFQRVLEAAAAPGTQSFFPSPSIVSATSASSGNSAVNHSATQPPLHRVHLTPTALLMNGTGRGGRAGVLTTALEAQAAAGPMGTTAAVAAPLPRRTPASLHPNLFKVMKEEEEEENHATAVRTENASVVAAAGVCATAATEERMVRMRHLLDTGRGSLLRQLPRACNPPLSWTPTEKKSDGLRAPAATPPMGSVASTELAILPWARKFILLAHPFNGSTRPSCVGKRARETPDGDALNEKENRRQDNVLPPSAYSTWFETSLPSLSQPHPHSLQWWIVDQHAVHERVRVEFFLCFADTYVLHPELQRDVAIKPIDSVRGRQARRGDGLNTMWVLSHHAQCALERRRRHTRLLQKLEKNHQNGSTSLCFGETLPFSSPSFSFPVVIPVEWRPRVVMVESHLRQWGWRFDHARETYAPSSPASAPLVLPTAVLSWPCLSVEGVEHRVTSLQALIETVEELEAIGGGEMTAPPSASSSLLVVPSAFLRFFISRSCRGAIMFGDVVAPTAARHMVVALECVEQYYFCSHGRPSFASLTPLKL